MVPGSSRSAPFFTRLLEEDAVPASAQDDLAALLPASYRTAQNDVAAAGLSIAQCLEAELDLRRLSSIHEWLWTAGRPLPPRPLHQQTLLGRDIVVTERMDTHLVWTTGRIFLKPIPRFLLEPCFWTKYLLCGSSPACSGDCTRLPGDAQGCKSQLRKCALGFLFSYTALISHESDFHIAVEKRLVPRHVEWQAWRLFVEELDMEHGYALIDRRFCYGELRLARLNKIYFLLRTPLRGYMPLWDQYIAFFADNLSWLAGAVVYIAIILSAMQVGLATDRLRLDRAFQSASYGFTVFAILGPLIAFALIFATFSCLFVYNWVSASRFHKRRFRHITPNKSPTVEKAHGNDDHNRAMGQREATFR